MVNYQSMIFTKQIKGITWSFKKTLCVLMNDASVGERFPYRYLSFLKPDVKRMDLAVKPRKTTG